MGSINNAENTTFAIQDAPVENLRPLRVVMIGTGFSGILAAIRIPQRLKNVDLVVYDKNDGVGGVWWVNRYPGVACDIPAHSYQYTFNPNPNWSNFYAPGAEIQKYLQHIAEKYGATRFFKLQHQVEECIWDAAQKKWYITVTNLVTGETFQDVADIVVSARGGLNDVAWPKISGMNKFKGKLLHSAEWDESYNFEKRKVGVIGNGSSAIQIVPQLQRLEGTTLKCFHRSPTWITAGYGDAAMEELGLDPNKTEFTQEQRESFEKDATAYLKMRKVIEGSGNLIQESTFLGSDMQRQFADTFKATMAEKLATRPDILKNLLPTFAPGCRRLTPGKGFLEALTKDNVEVINETITAVTETGITLDSGRQVELDALVCATGFNVAAAPTFEVVGKDGLTLRQRWQPYPESYLGVVVDGFPNFLMISGPNSGIGFGSLTKMIEAQTDYVVKIIRKVQKEGYATVEVKPERLRDFQQYIGTYFKNTIYMDNCKTWYRFEGPNGKWVFILWPGSTLHALETLRSPRWEDFNFETTDPSGNRFAWLGNGSSVAQTEGDPSWYLNPEEVDYPLPGHPEDSPQNKARPWSH
ncbi:related to monooxigenase [Fusarium oxysporum]|uniref:Related to monooxigenase n=1 Tax=Fusarium oxysporum TaxID=5507 RepID=A0A2H3TVN9_FUSOX|nr:related to monooxigenase [Fusarium oxysporum]